MTTDRRGRPKFRGFAIQVIESPSVAMLLYARKGSTSYAEHRRGVSPLPRAPSLKLKYFGKCLEIGLLSMGFYLNLPGNCLRVKLASRCLASWSQSLFNDGRRVRVRLALIG